MSTSTKSRRARKRLSSIHPSPENDILYKPIPDDDPDIIALAESIEKNGLHEDITIDLDGNILSGHRRYKALQRLGRQWVHCKVVPVRRSTMGRDDYLALLRDYNRQRHKSVAEQVREEILDGDPEQAWHNLNRRRTKSLSRYTSSGLEKLEIEGESVRCVISDEKGDHVEYVKRVIFTDRKKYWPLSVRQVHYGLLNYTFMRNTRRKLKYRNDDRCYKATSDLVTRLRLNGVIPWSAITDGTRPVTTYRAFSDVRQFVRQELDRLFDGYWRDYLQTQPNYIEVLCEKNTVYHMVERVTREFMVPVSSGRGFGSVDALHEIVERYEASGKGQLILIVMSDFDPEGECIPQVVGRALRDDFGIRSEKIVILKAGVTREQIEKFNLPPQNFAKETSSRHQWFVDRNGGDDTVYELEALPPEAMLADLRDCITSCLDVELFNGEVETERAESLHLEACRSAAADTLRGLDL